jgi:hypothetical protein
MDKKWEDADIDSCVDVCLITGQPGRTDSGRNEILLCGRLYREDFSIPVLTDSRDQQDLINNTFLLSCYNTISKSGFATHRVGGSAPQKSNLPSLRQIEDVFQQRIPKKHGRRVP